MACLNRISCNGFEGLFRAISLGTSYYIGLTLLTILVVVLLVYAYRVWAEIHEDIESDTPSDLLDTFKEAHAAGELDEEELRRVRQLLLHENVNRLGITPRRCPRSTQERSKSRRLSEILFPIHRRAKSLTVIRRQGFDSGRVQMSGGREIDPWSSGNPDKPSVRTLSTSARQSPRACLASSPRVAPPASPRRQPRPPRRTRRIHQQIPGAKVGMFDRAIRLDHGKRHRHVSLAAEVGKLKRQRPLVEINLEAVSEWSPGLTQGPGERRPRDSGYRRGTG